MTILIQPLSPHGQPVGESFTSDWTRFLEANDGFSIAEIAYMEAAFNMGSAYRLGGGASGEYRLSKVNESRMI